MQYLLTRTLKIDVKYVNLLDTELQLTKLRTSMKNLKEKEFQKICQKAISGTVYDNDRDKNNDKVIRDLEATSLQTDSAMGIRKNAAVILF